MYDANWACSLYFISFPNKEYVFLIPMQCGKKKHAFNKKPQIRFFKKKMKEDFFIILLFSTISLA